MANDSGILHNDAPPPESDILGEGAPDLGDSKVLSGRTSAGRLKIYEVGELIVVGFGGKDVPSEYCIAESRDILAELIREHSCKELVFDLTGVRLVPSGMLGVLASIRNLGVAVSICNPSPDVREVLATTQLDQIIQVRDVDL